MPWVRAAVEDNADPPAHTAPASGQGLLKGWRAPAIPNRFMDQGPGTSFMEAFHGWGGKGDDGSSVNESNKGATEEAWLSHSPTAPLLLCSAIPNRPGI